MVYVVYIANKRSIRFFTVCFNPVLNSFQFDNIVYASDAHNTKENRFSVNVASGHL